MVVELLELGRAVPAVDLGDHGAVGDVERREQGRHAVPNVVVGAFLRHAGHHREHGLAAGEGLHLGLSSTQKTTALSGGSR